MSERRSLRPFTRSLKVILAALAFSSRSYSRHTRKRLNRLPRGLRQAVATEFSNVGDLLLAHKASVKEAGSAIAKHAVDWREEVEKLCEDIAKLREQIVEISDCDNRSRESVLAKIVEERKAIQKAAEEILSISERRILLGLAAAFAAGVVCNPVLGAIIAWIWRML